MTWNVLVQLEPRLAQLLLAAQAQHRKAKTKEARFRIWIGSLKPCLMRLVGWESASVHKQLRSQKAYDLAYDVIYGALIRGLNENTEELAA